MRACCMRERWRDRASRRGRRRDGAQRIRDQGASRRDSVSDQGGRELLDADAAAPMSRPAGSGPHATTRASRVRPRGDVCK